MADKKPQGANRDPEAPELDPAGEASKALQGKKLTPPIRGDAQVDFIRAPVKREGNTLKPPS